MEQCFIFLLSRASFLAQEWVNTTHEQDMDYMFLTGDNCYSHQLILLSFNSVDNISDSSNKYGGYM